MNDYEDEFLRIRNRLDQYKPEVWHRNLEMVKVGTWFFGLLSIYELRPTAWEKDYE